MRSKQIIFIPLVVLLFTSCALGHRHNYHDTIANIAASGNITVALATHDQRQYILSGQSAPEYVGMRRGGFGNPFNITTVSGKPLAEDITTSICNSLSAKGYKAVAVSVVHSDTRDKVIEKMKQSESKRLLLVTLNEWQSDTSINTGLSYNVRLEVLDSNGHKLAEKIIKGDDNFRSSVWAWDPLAEGREAIHKAFKEKLEALLNSGEVLKTLQ